MTDFLRFNRGWMLGSWRWPLGAVLALVAAILSAMAEAWVTAVIFLLVSLALCVLTVYLRGRRT